MRSYSDIYKINGKSILVPDAPLQISYDDMLSPDSANDEAGVPHDIVMDYKRAKYTFIYSAITEEEKSYMESLFPDAPTFDFTHPDRKDSSLSKTSKAKRTGYSIAYHDVIRGLWMGYKFVVQEIRTW